MRRIVLTLLTCGVLLGCSKTQNQSSSAVKFARFGAAREEVEAELRASGGTILTSSTEILVARVNAKHLQRPMNVKLTFKDGRLAAVNYWPPTLTADYVMNARVGLLGYRKATDVAISPPASDYYFFFGPLGHFHLGSGGIMAGPTAAFGAVAVLAATIVILVARRRRC